jgi:hypothetical protein
VRFADLAAHRAALSFSSGLSEVPALSRRPEGGRVISYGMPPTVRCPGCAQPVEIGHEAHRTLQGITVYVPTETEADALLRHMDVCPNIERSEQ